MDKSNWSLIFERPKTVEEKGRGKDRRRGRGREEEEKRGEEERKIKNVWNYEILYGILKFCMNFHAIGWLVACP